MSNKMSNKNNDLKTLKLRAGFLIILVAVVSLCITILSGGLWFANIDYSNIFRTESIMSSNDKNAEIQSINHEELFEEYYYGALDVLSNTVAYGTTWLELCVESQTLIGEDTYMKVCSNMYSSLKDIRKTLGEYVSTDLIDIYMSDYYKEYNNGLYVLPISITKDSTYAGFESYTLKNKTANKIEYIVTSKYSGFNCGDNCKYSYKKQSFVLEKQNNEWKVLEIELPY